MRPVPDLDYTVLVEQRDGASCWPRRPSRSRVAGEVLHTAADGNGPVNALDEALRKALRAFYPGLDDVHLVDYKVRILDGGAATAARTRVIIDCWTAPDVVDHGQRHNIIAASAAALADSIEYAIRKSGAAAPPRRAPLHDPGWRGAESPWRSATTPAPAARLRNPRM